MGDVGKRHGAKMVEGFKNSELGECEARACEMTAGMVAGGVGGTHEPDVGGQGQALLGAIR